jgi:acyl dehydratase
MSQDSWTVSTASAGLKTVARTYEIPVRMAQAYAAGVGDWNPAYFHDDSPEGVLAPPCLVYALQWNARMMPGVDQGTAPPTRGVHATTDLRFERPIRAGDVLTVQGTRIAVCQRKPGVYVVTRFEMRDPTGALVATVDDGGIVRGARTDGADVTLADTPPLPAPTGDKKDGWSTTIPISREAAHVYTECADIWNPIHTERRVALDAGLPDVILQGSAIMALAARELTNRVAAGDPTRLARLAGQFRAMVIPGSEIRVTCLGVCSSPSQHASPPHADEQVAFFEVLNAQGQAAVRGGAAVFRGTR